MSDLFEENAVTLDAGFSETQVVSEVPKALTDQIEKNTEDIANEITNRTNADKALDTIITENKKAITTLQKYTVSVDTEGYICLNYNG